MAYICSTSFPLACGVEFHLVIPVQLLVTLSLQMADEGKGQLLITVVRNGTEVFFLSKLFTIVLLLNVSLQE